MKNRRKKYTTGGQQLATTAATAATAAIPGAGPFLAPFVGAGLGHFFGQKQEAPAVRMTSSYAKGGKRKYAKGGYPGTSFTGPTHEGGGIPLTPEMEVEGGESMMMKGGTPYIFSNRVRVPGSGLTFAAAHKKLMAKGGSAKAMDTLAMMQEKVTGRMNSSAGQPQVSYAYGGVVAPDDPRTRQVWTLPNDSTRSTTGAGVFTSRLPQRQIRPVAADSLTRGKPLWPNAPTFQSIFQKARRTLVPNSPEQRPQEYATGGSPIRGRLPNNPYHPIQMQGPYNRDHILMQELDAGAVRNPINSSLPTNPYHPVQMQGPYNRNHILMDELDAGAVRNTPHTRPRTGPIHSSLPNNPYHPIQMQGPYNRNHILMDELDSQPPNMLPEVAVTANRHAPLAGLGHNPYAPQARQRNAPVAGLGHNPFPAEATGMPAPNRRAGTSPAANPADRRAIGRNPIFDSLPSDPYYPIRMQGPHNENHLLIQELRGDFGEYTPSTAAQAAEQSPSRARTGSAAAPTAGPVPVSPRDAPTIGRVSAGDIPASMRSVPGVKEAAPLVGGNRKAGQPVEAQASSAAVGENRGDFWAKAASYGPDIANALMATFARDKTRPATRVNQRAVGMMPTTYNIAPQREAASASYRALMQDPGVTANMALAGHSANLKNTSDLYGQKFNMENQMRMNQAQMQGQLDMVQSRHDAQYREDKMMSDANRGLSGNFARQSLSNLSTRYLQNRMIDKTSTVGIMSQLHAISDPFERSSLAKTLLASGQLSPTERAALQIYVRD